MPARDEYRKKAEACVAQALLLRNPQERASLLVIARTYIKLADRIGARHERGTARRSQSEARAENDS
jgi:hypothetical protein